MQLEVNQAIVVIEWINYNLEVDESEDYVTAIPIKNLILDPTHPFILEGIEP